MDDIDKLLASIDPTVKSSLDAILEPQQPKARSHQQHKRRLDQLNQQRRSRFAAIAKTWLTELDPDTAEGRWFDEFACHYESRLDAAIDYLEALREVDSKR